MDIRSPHPPSVTRERTARDTARHTAERPRAARRYRSPLALAATLGVTLLLLAGCAAEDAADDAAAAAADDAAEEAADDAAPAAADDAAEEAADDAAEEAADDATAAAAEPEVIEVEMIDFGYLGMPESVPAGTRFTVTNSAEFELHELVAFALDDEDDRALEELIQLSPPELVAALGQPVAVLLAEPGGPQIPAVGDGTLSEPGRYAIMCFIPTGVEPQVYLEAAAATAEGPPQVEGGPPHFVQGMYRELVVE